MNEKDKKELVETKLSVLNTFLRAELGITDYSLSYTNKGDRCTKFTYDGHKYTVCWYPDRYRGEYLKLTGTSHFALYSDIGSNNNIKDIDGVIKYLSNIKSNNKQNTDEVKNKQNTDEYETLNPDYDTDESMEYKTGKGLEYFNNDKTLKSYDIDERQLKTEGIHLTAYVKNPYDTAQPNRIFTIEDSDYNSKQQFRNDLKANGYIVKSISDNRDLYVIDNSNYRNLADAERDLRRYKQWQKDTKQHNPDSTLWQSNIDEIQELVDAAKKIPLTENKSQKIESKHKVEEVSRNELLAKSKSQTITRYKKSAAYKGFYIVDIDTTSVFTTNSLRVTCKVGDYWDTVEMENILYWVQIEAEKNDNRQINTKGVTAAIMNSIDGMDIKVDCNCRRFLFRRKY